MLYERPDATFAASYFVCAINLRGIVLIRVLFLKQTNSYERAKKMLNLGFGPPEVLILLLIGFGSIIPAIFACLIFSKAGYHWALGLFVLVPIANLIILIYFAVDRWPVLLKLDRLEAQQAPMG